MDLFKRIDVVGDPDMDKLDDGTLPDTYSDNERCKNLANLMIDR